MTTRALLFARVKGALAFQVPYEIEYIASFHRRQVICQDSAFRHSVDKKENLLREN